MLIRDTHNKILPSPLPAVEHAGRSVNYAQFCHAVSQLAQQIQQTRSGRDAPIAIVMDRGFELYASQFAVLSWGGFFLPIDPANPNDRIKFLLTDSQADCVVVDSASLQRIKKLELEHCPPLLVQPDFVNAPAPESVKPIVFPHAADDPAYMIYTSGSTGKPKGVCIHWQAICNHDQWFIDQYGITQNDRCLQIASIGFDISIEEIFTTLRSDACLVPINKDALNSPAEFFQWVNDRQLTVLNMPTALWHNVVPSLTTSPFPPSVRLLLIGGEQVNPDVVRTWFQHVSPKQVRLVNAYGPTETTITATVSDLSPENTYSIGRPIDNLECHILDNQNRLIESSDTPGELYISGAGVAKGYWNRPEKTAQSFMHCDAINGKWCYRTGDKVQLDERGQLCFLGRIDNQVKLRGYRIELSEIENTVRNHQRINDAVVRKITGAREQLVCFATHADREQQGRERPDPTSLQHEIVSFLGHTLPAYMLPSQFVFLDKFPTTVGGKIDIEQLVLLASNTASHAAPDLHEANQVQTTISKVWESVLGNPPATFDTTFEQAGGDSLSAMALALGLENLFPQTSFGVATLLSYPTVNQLAQYIEHVIDETDGDPLTPLINKLGQPLDSHTPCLIFLHPGGGSGYLYNQLIDASIKNTYSILILDSPWLTRAIPEDNHQETTVTLAQRYAKVLQEHLSPGSQIVTAGYSFGGILAFETARYLAASGFKIKQVINIDQPIPAAVSKASLSNRIINWLHRLKTPRLTRYELNYSKEKEALQLGKPTQFSNPQEMLHSFNLEDVHARIEDAYQPTFCDLEMRIIRGDVIEAKYQVANDYGWGKYTRRLFVDRTSGTHFTLFLGRNLKKLSTKFQKLLSSR